MSTLDPIRAATAPDPYPYYAQLVAEKPVYWDAQLELWVASSAHAVEALLRCTDLTVRPATEPIPQTIAGTSAGDLFGRFMRMRDDAPQAALKNAALEALAAFAAADADEWARQAAAEFPSSDIDWFASAFAPFALARALGLSTADALDAAHATVQYARSFAPSAADALWDLMTPALSHPSAQSPLLSRFKEAAQRAGIDSRTIAANAAGFLFQSCDATAGLIGNALWALANRTSANVRDAVSYAVRFDSPVQNTRRFARDAVEVAGVRVEPGQTVLLLIAAANRDPGAQRAYTFGMGRHACPGERIACAIASAACEQLTNAFDISRLRLTGYRPSQNLRIPEFSFAL
jgi:cytochrome P450